MDAERAVERTMQTTGNPWVPTPDDPATVPVPLPVIIVNVVGAYNEQDRKLWTFLLHSAWDELGETAVHRVSVREVGKIFRDHNTRWIWESARRLASTVVEWVRTDGDTRYKGVASLFSAEIPDKEELQHTDVLRFSFPSMLVPILKDPKRFARLRTHFMIELSGKYAVTLYELLESVANKDIPVLRASIEELRSWLKVPSERLTRWQDFRRRVLEPAIKQINGSPEGAGFTVKMRTQKEGRGVKWVLFEVSKTNERIAIDTKLKEREQDNTRQGDLFQIRLKTETYEIARAYARGWDIYALETEWVEWGKKRGDWAPKNPDKAFIGFCKNRGAYPGH